MTLSVDLINLKLCLVATDLDVDPSWVLLQDANWSETDLQG